MSRRRYIALAMVLLDTGIAGFFFKSWVFAPAIGVAAVVGGLGRWQLAASRTRDQRLGLALIVVVVLAWRLFGVEGAVASAGLQDGLGFALAQLFLAVQVYELFVRREGGISSWFVLFGAIVMIAAGDVIVAGSWERIYNLAYLAASLVFVTLIAAFWVTGRKTRATNARTRRPWGIALATLALSLILGTFLAVGLKENQQDLDTWFANLIAPRAHARALGFPDRAYLHSIGDIKEHDAASVSLRIVSKRIPGYMKGLAYDLYRDGQWTLSVQGHSVQPEPRALGLGPERGMETFDLIPQPPRVESTMRVWPEVNTTGAFFTPYDAVRLHAPYESVVMDALGNVGSPDNSVRAPYELDESNELPTETLTKADRARYTVLPGNFDPAVEQLAADLFANAPTAQEKVAAVVQYFQENYEYSLKISVPNNVDPLTYFLLERPPAHCEFFASGAAILLRLGGVPTRYVTGFVAVERNTFGDYWIARNRDAHAWVEAYDPSRGWFLVEATVSDGVPAEDAELEPSRLSQAWDYAKFLVREVVAAYVVGGVRGVARWIGDALVRFGAGLLAPIPATTIVLLAIAVVVWEFRRKRSAPERIEVAYVAELRALLAEMDRYVQRTGIERAPHETLSHFAARLSGEIGNARVATDVAQWYRTYARLRFGPPPSSDQLTTLREALPKPR